MFFSVQLVNLRGESCAGTLLVSYCLCNKQLLTQWLKTMSIYDFAALEVRSMKWASRSWHQSVGRDVLPGGEINGVFLGETLCASLSQLPGAACIPGLVVPPSFFEARKHIPLACTSIATSLFLIFLPPFCLFQGGSNEIKQVESFYDLWLH